MRSLIVAAVAVSVAAAAPGQEPSALFNGKDLSGWTAFLEKRGPNAEGTMLMGDVWTAGGEVLRCSGVPTGYLRTIDDYRDFVLSLEWRWPGKPGNSGVLLRVLGADQIWPRSVEVQLLSGNAGDFWLMEGAPLATPPGHLDSIAANHRPRRRDAEKAAGEWNHLEVMLRGDRVAVKVNGTLVNEGTGADQLAGKIALQSEGAPVEFRNIRLAPLL